MKTKEYISPEISLIDTEANDIITTSEVGVETTPVSSETGIWEAL